MLLFRINMFYYKVLCLETVWDQERDDIHIDAATQQHYIVIDAVLLNYL